MLADALSTKEKLMRAAVEIVAEDGFAAATTAAIAARAGVAEGTLYRHFAGKDELMIAAYRQLKSDIFAASTDTYDESAPFEARLAHLWRAVIDAYRRDRAGFRFGQRFGESALSAKEGGAAHEAMTGALTRLRDDARARGEVKDLPMELFIALFYAPAIALLKRELSGREWTDAELAKAAQAIWHSWRA